ncbi:glycosyltransferase family 4 protein [Candidatus Poriferisodalis sp.]|uniref:glycosyltransferase family 4 protein n=1 Tax=Candidatus Poriferisodalis sp. TaxID=3101277 RepID=UPI003B02B21B
MRLLVVCPHLEPDTAPTGEVISRVILELARSGHEIDVVTALPWYRGHRVAAGWGGRPLRRSHRGETLPAAVAGGPGAGSVTVTRVHPFPTRRRSLAARGAGFAGFTLLAAAASVLRRTRPDAVLAMSPPLTLGLAGWAAARRFGVPLVFNVQDVFPDAAIEVGAISNRRIITASRRLERLVYGACDAVTVLSEEMRANVAAKVDPARGPELRIIPNFSDTAEIRPQNRHTAYRTEHGLGERTVVMYAGNIGYSQPLETLVAAARACRDRRDMVFVVNGEGSAREALEESATGLPNLVLVDFQPAARISEVLASADVHVILLREGLAHSSVPSKLYSIMAAGRPVLAAVDPGTEVARVLERTGCGEAVAPADETAFIAALQAMIDDPRRRAQMGARGRAFAEAWFSASDAAGAYGALLEELTADR